MAPKEEYSTTLSSSSSAASTSSSCHGSSLKLSSSSRSIANKPQKKQPIIRVVHVYAPKLIKTDPANFRTLVQKLTGNTASCKHDEEIVAHDHDDEQLANHQRNPKYSNSDYHDNTNNLHYFANHGDLYEGIRVLESSGAPKREINRRKKSSFSAVTDPAVEIKALQVVQNPEDATVQNGFFLSSNFIGLDGISGDREGDNPGLASVDESDGGAELGNQQELAARAAEDILNEYYEYRYMSSPSSLGASSSCSNTESAGIFDEIRDGFDEGLGSFSDVRRHYFMRLEGDELLLHPAF